MKKQVWKQFIQAIECLADETRQDTLHVESIKDDERAVSEFLTKTGSVRQRQIAAIFDLAQNLARYK